MTNRFNIVPGRGPNKFDFMMALFDRAKGSRTVEFVLKECGKNPVSVVITRIEWEGGHEKWLFKGWFHPGGTMVEGYYDTQGRCGFIDQIV
jgi:hypothetical protein